MEGNILRYARMGLTRTWKINRVNDYEDVAQEIRIAVMINIRRLIDKGITDQDIIEQMITNTLAKRSIDALRKIVYARKHDNLTQQKRNKASSFTRKKEIPATQVLSTAKEKYPQDEMDPLEILAGGSLKYEPSRAAIQREQSREILQWFRRVSKILSPEESSALRSYYLRNQDMKTTGNILGVKESRAAQLVRSARAKIKQHFGIDLPDPRTWGNVKFARVSH